VQEIIDVNVGWQDASNVLVLSPDMQQVLTYLVTNTGNGEETFSLSVNSAPAITDDFDPINTSIFIDSNGNGIFDGTATEIAYIPGVNDLQLDANAVDSQTVFVLSDIPPSLSIDETGVIEFIANSTTSGAAGAAPGTVLVGAGDIAGGSPTDAAVGLTQASANVTGTYQIDQGIDINIIKSAQVIDDTAAGGTCTIPPCIPAPGATIRYTLTVNAQGGINTAENVVITDPIPVDTTYKSGSIVLDGAPLTDSSTDADAGFMSADVVTVNLGDLNDEDSHLITFDVTIN
jgi:uncharacterized repeat protein (TIGR01451 family)